MITSDFPCRVCGHAAERHYTNVATCAGICTACSRYEPGDAIEYIHDFVGDNLRYVELKKKRQELMNEQA
jgi:hypothetical protein